MPLESPLTIVESLQQSRCRLLYDTLPLLTSTKPQRSSAIPSDRPPYELQHLITLAVSIGPHQFAGTKLSRVEWRSSKPISSPPVEQLQSNVGGPAQSSHPSGPAPERATTEAAESPTPSSDIVTSAMIESLVAESITSATLGISSQPHTAVTPTPTTPTEPGPDQPTRRPGLAIQFREAPTETYLLPPHFSCESLSGGKAALCFWLVPNDRRAPGTTTTKGKATTTMATSRDPLTDNFPVPITIVLEDSVTSEIENALEGLSCRGRDRSKVDAWWNRLVSLVPPRTHITRQRPPTPPPPPEPRDFSSFVSSAPPIALRSRLDTNGGNSSEVSPGPSSEPLKKRKRPSSGRRPAARRPSATTRKGSTSRAGSASASASGSRKDTPEPKRSREASTVAATAPTAPTVFKTRAEPIKSRSGRTHRPKSFGDEYALESAS